ncbi:hypothetical protein FEM48_Zijuj09G0184300 [Ziziphus jujuba var. spinosa]|uniref:J domain-containing protein n=1 Tax=Ziziphus jujuba var. spinosa TaxID=714518 RepID=A0A978UUK8_ZIZJJ|nr:hypothetical protein FEM48_Zijuj09G0184300 [Ziziphus jujuba var. spinosa]
MLCLSTEKASMDEIKKAYRSMALRHHPDVCLDPSMKEESTKMFVKLNEAYQTLSDPVLRKEYDYEMLLRSASSGRTFKVDLNDQLGRRRKWQEQIVELKKRSNSRMAQKEGSWGCRMRAKNDDVAITRPISKDPTEMGNVDEPELPGAGAGACSLAPAPSSGAAAVDGLASDPAGD